MDSLKEIAEEIAQSPAILKEIYGDLTKPSVQQVGKALGTIIGLGNTVLWPFALLNEKAKIALERNLERYRIILQALETLPSSSARFNNPTLCLMIFSLVFNMRVTSYGYD